MKRKILAMFVITALIFSFVISSYAADIENNYNFSTAQEYTINDLMDYAKQRTYELELLGYNVRYDEYNSGKLLKISYIGDAALQVGPDKLYAVSTSIEIVDRPLNKIHLYFTIVSLDTHKLTAADKLTLKSGLFNSYETKSLTLREPTTFSSLYLNTIDADLMSEINYKERNADKLIKIFESRDVKMTLTGTYKLEETLPSGFCRDAEGMVKLFKELCERYNEYLRDDDNTMEGLVRMLDDIYN